jgi:hypothetical protein
LVWHARQNFIAERIEIEMAWGCYGENPLAQYLLAFSILSGVTVGIAGF